MAKITVRSLTNYQQLVMSSEHALVADEPKGVGDGLGPNPYELLLGALGTCTAMTVLMYARRKGWALESVGVELSFDRIHAEDCADYEQENGMVDSMGVRLRFDGDLDQQQVDRLAYIASRCPVRKTLLAGPRILDEVSG